MATHRLVSFSGSAGKGATFASGMLVGDRILSVFNVDVIVDNSDLFARFCMDPDYIYQIDEGDLSLTSFIALVESD